MPNGLYDTPPALFAIVQCLGALGIAIELLRAQARHVSTMFRAEFAIDGLALMQFVLLGAWPGAAISALGLVRTGLSQTLPEDRFRMILIYAIVPAFVVSGLLSATGWIGLLPLAGAVASSVAFLHLSHRNRAAGWFATCCICWTSYGLLEGALVGAIGSAAAGLSLIVGMWRHRVRDGNGAFAWRRGGRHDRPKLFNQKYS